ncbi:MAG: DUF4394 domain-containing protein [Geminicoccaceae bacterium]
MTVNALVGAMTALVLTAGSTVASAADIVALTGQRTLQVIDHSPAVRRTLQVTGIGSALLGIVVRPADGRLYGLLANGQVVTISTRTGVATPKVRLVLPAPLPAHARFSVDFNPAVDRLRIVSDAGTNLAANVDDGSVVAGTAPAFPPPPAVNPFGGTSPAVIAVAYTNSKAGVKGTLLFDIDDATDALYLQQPPAAGTLTNVGGQLGIGVGTVGFDIRLERSRNTAYLISGSRLYQPDLLTGSAGRGKRIKGLSGPVRDVAALF